MPVGVAMGETGVFVIGAALAGSWIVDNVNTNTIRGHRPHPWTAGEPLSGEAYIGDQSLFAHRLRQSATQRHIAREVRRDASKVKPLTGRGRS